MIPDERLGLVFACCHPALALEAQVPLTLRLVGGLTVPEIARALLLPEATVAQRLVRAKQKMRALGHPARRAAARRAARAAARRCSPCSTSSSTRATRRRRATRSSRDDLAAEAIRLARVVHALLPDEPEPAGLLALMLLAPRAPRRRASARGGELVLLEDQDRARWDRARDRRGAAARRPRADAAPARRARTRCRRRSRRVHAARARAPRTTDWRQIARSTASCARAARARSWRSTAPSRSRWPTARRAGLALIDDARGGALDDYHLLHAARADLLRRDGPPRRGGGRLPARARAGGERSRSARFLAARLRGVRT